MTTGIVQVGDYNAGLGDDGSLSLRQWRVYRWTGTGSTQTYGPTSFPVNPHVTDLAISTTPLAFGAAQGGQRTGVMRITVRNLGPSPTPYSVLVNLPAGANLVPTAGCAVETFVEPSRSRARPASWPPAPLAGMT